jgi:hypothetical protein
VRRSKPQHRQSRQPSAQLSQGDHLRFRHSSSHSSMQSQKAQYGHHNHNEADKINNPIHDFSLAHILRHKKRREAI